MTLGLLAGALVGETLLGPWELRRYGVAVFAGSGVFLSVLIERSRRALRAAQDLAERLRSLHQLIARMAEVESRSEVADLVMDELTQAFAVRGVAVASLDTQEGALELLGARALKLEAVEACRSCGLEAEHPIAQACRERRLIVYADGETFAQRYPVLRSLFLGSSDAEIAAVPLLVSGRCVGAFVALFTPGIRLGGHALDHLAVLASHAAQALERANLREHDRACQARSDRLAEATRLFDEAGLDRQVVLARVAQRMALQVGDACVVRLMSADRLRLELVAQHQRHASELVAALADPKVICLAEDSPHCQVVAQCQALFLPRGAKSSNGQLASPSDHGGSPSDSVGRLMIVPLLVRGEVIGTCVVARSGEQATFALEEFALARELAERAAIVLDNCRLYAEASQAVQARDVFLSVASHELKTPLAAAQLTLEHASRQLDTLTAAELARKLEVARRNYDKIASVLEHLFDVSKLHTEGLHLAWQPVDLDEVVRNVICRNEEVFASEGYQVTLRSPGPIRGRWDSLRLDQVVSNLLQNAVKYGSKQPIEVSLTASNEHAVLSVRDRGIGIGPQDQQRIFERFERAVDGHRYSGIGVGLWLARSIVEAHGGAIHVESSVGRGSTFVVELPRQPRTALSEVSSTGS